MLVPIKVDQRKAIGVFLAIARAYGMQAHHRVVPIATAKDTLLQGMIVVGDFGVHPAIEEITPQPFGVEITCRWDWWSITFIPRGMKIIDVSSCTLALACIKKFQKLDWALDQTGIPKIPKTRMLGIVKEACDRFNQEEGCAR